MLLALDTAGPYCAVALARASHDGPEILVKAAERIVRGHAERLMPMIDAALDEAGLAFGDLERIAVTTGPGSFTGVRVGVAAARALALALDIPCVGIGSLDALAIDAVGSHDHGAVVALLDARRDEVYASVHDVKANAVLMEPSVLRVEELARQLRSAPKPLILTGSAAPLLAAVLDDSAVQIFATPEAPQIASVAVLGLRAEAGAPPAPVYLRGADAKPQAGKAVARA